MKKFGVLLLLALVALTPSVAIAQTAAGFSGKWEGTMQRTDDASAKPSPLVFNLTQKGHVLTGTAGPADQQLPIEKGAVTAGKATFNVSRSNGAMFQFALTIVKGHLQGDMTGVGADGSVRGHAKVDATKAPKK